MLRGFLEGRQTVRQRDCSTAIEDAVNGARDQPSLERNDETVAAALLDIKLTINHTLERSIGHECRQSHNQSASGAGIVTCRIITAGSDQLTNLIPTDAPQADLPARNHGSFYH
jgi:hypothetical protein